MGESEETLHFKINDARERLVGVETSLRGIDTRLAAVEGSQSRASGFAIAQLAGIAVLLLLFILGKLL